MDPLSIVTSLTIVLLLGLVMTIISQKLKMTNVLPLILMGIILHAIKVNGEPLVQFPPVFLTSIGILALVLIVFEGSSEFKMKEFDANSFKVIRLVVMLIAFNLVFLSLFTWFTFKTSSLAITLIFSSIMAGTSAGVVLTMFKGQEHKVIRLLHMESILNTPFTVILPFIIIDLLVSAPEGFALGGIVLQISPFIQQFVTGIGAGIVVAIIVFKIMGKFYSPLLSPFALFITALLAYVIAENLGGNGVLAVTTLGLFFGSSSILKKAEMQKYSSIFSTSLEILVFVLVGLIVNVPGEWQFYLKSILLFALYVMIRYFTMIALFRKELKIREIWFMALTMPKGIAVATVAFSLVAFELVGLGEILDLTLFFMLYSIIVSTVTARFSKYFIKTKIQVEEVIEKVEPKKSAANS